MIFIEVIVTVTVPRLYRDCHGDHVKSHLNVNRDLDAAAAFKLRAWDHPRPVLSLEWDRHILSSQ